MSLLQIQIIFTCKNVFDEELVLLGVTRLVKKNNPESIGLKTPVS
jgi:hypothetical protein